MRRTPRLEGAVLLALGVIAIVEALRLKDDWQGAKLMPAVIGGVLVLLGTAHFAMKTEPGSWPDAASGRRVTLLFGVLALYVAVLPRAGFLPATAVFVLVLVRALGAFSWGVTLAYTLAIALGSHVVFRQWLGMPLPQGLLGF